MGAFRVWPFIWLALAVAIGVALAPYIGGLLAFLIVGFAAFLALGFVVLGYRAIRDRVTAAGRRWVAYMDRR